MNNVLDYLKWRGDVPMTGSPFNEIDNIILSMTTFVDFTDIVPSDPSGEPVSFPAAMKRFDQGDAGQKNYIGAIIPASLLDIARRAAECPRFSDMLITGFDNEEHEQAQMQFAALTYLLSDGSVYVAFRGTDDTIVGWKEDVMLGFKTPIPAHIRAVEYIEKMAEARSGGIRIGGHSKGGNIAMWAAAFSSPRVRDRVIRVYNNDGPGFLPEVVSSSQYLEVADRIITFIPQSSVVGVLLEQSPHYQIIKSTQAGIMQHDPLSWEVMGARFVYLDKRSRFGIQSDENLRRWVYSMDDEQRGKFADMLFGIIDATGARTLTDLSSAKLKNFNVIMKSLRELDKDSRDMMFNALIALLGGRPAKPRTPAPGQLPQGKQPTAPEKQPSLVAGKTADKKRDKAQDK